MIKGPDARELAERLRSPKIRPEARKLYRGALAEFAEAEEAQKQRTARRSR